MNPRFNTQLFQAAPVVTVKAIRAVRLARRIEAVFSSSPKSVVEVANKPIPKHDRLRAATETIFHDAFHRATIATEALVLQHPKKDGRKKKEAALLALFLLWLTNAAEESYAAAAPALADAALNDFKGLPPNAHEYGYAPSKAELEAFAAERGILLADVPGRVLAELDAEVSRSRELGETQAELAKRLKVVAQEIEQREGQRVAATEAQAVLGHAQLRALRNAGFTKKRWVTEGDERVRDSHNACESQGAIGLDGRFGNGLRYPGDPEGGPEEVCNCRCFLEGVR